MTNISTEEILDALRTAMEPKAKADGYSTRELAVMAGCSYDKMRAALGVAIARGQIKSSSGLRLGIDGVNRYTPIYHFVHPS